MSERIFRVGAMVHLSKNHPVTIASREGKEEDIICQLLNVSYFIIWIIFTLQPVFEAHA